MEGFVLIYITAQDREQALELARALVAERLVACANVVPQIFSFYWWEGRLCEEQEALILAKTTAEKCQEVVARVRELHTYQVPAVLCLPVAGGNADFLEWVRTETGGRSAP
ncbi:MAG: divalent-cation tolerance protein CutA [Firmicutes bacterium]|nr:divalent-cation tolerance protein CutA [Bacillota bacterium]